VAEDITDPVRCYRLAAGIWHKNNLVGLGVNSYKTDPFQAKYGKHEHAIHLHAEIAAIKNAARQMDDLSRCTLIVVRVKRKFSEQNKNIFQKTIAKPCSGCYKCIVEFGIKNVFYTNLNGEVEKL
jgi:deoxycytidylate deaminase